MNSNKKSFAQYHFPLKVGAGFTIVEILVVVAIIGILAGIILMALSGAKEKAKEVKAKAEARQIYNAILMLESDSNQWPGHQTPNEINQIGTNELCPDFCTYKLSDKEGGLVDTDGNYPNWNGPYIKEIPLDSWGNEYFFDTDYDRDLGAGRDWVVAIGSYGADGRERNGYDSGFADDDIIYVITE